jgi:hypothetical protein
MFPQDAFFQDIDELQNQGIGAADIQKLKVAGICTVRVRLSHTQFINTFIYNKGRHDDTETRVAQNQGHERCKGRQNPRSSK